MKGRTTYRRKSLQEKRGVALTTWGYRWHTFSSSRTETLILKGSKKNAQREIFLNKSENQEGKKNGGESSNVLACNSWSKSHPGSCYSGLNISL